VTVWHELAEGTVIDSPTVEVTDELVGELVRLGGYVHPLFTDPDYVRTSSPLPARPLPGAAVLHLMGGLAEQCEVLDGTVLALLGFDGVRFRSPALAGDVLRLRLTIGDTVPAGRAGREELALGWTMVREDGSVVAEASARMLVARP
jgi:acyl dehydratase